MSRLLFTLKRIVKSDRSKSEHTASERQPRSHGRERGRSERGAGAASVEKGPAEEAGSAAGCEIDNMTLRIDELIIASLGYSNLFRDPTVTPETSVYQRHATFLPSYLLVASARMLYDTWDVIPLLLTMLIILFEAGPVLYSLFLRFHLPQNLM